MLPPTDAAPQTQEDWTHKSFLTQPSFDPAAVGDAGPEVIYFAVGAALSSWERLEEEIGGLFTILTHDETGKSYHLNRHMFGMMESSSVRMKMVMMAAQLYFGYDWEIQEVSLPFRTFQKVFETASHRRNEIAHGRVTQVQWHQGNDQPPKNSGAFLTSPDYAINRQQPFFTGDWHPDDILGIDRSKYRYRAQDILEFRRKFERLSSEMFNLKRAAAKGEHKKPNIILELAAQGRLLKPAAKRNRRPK